MAAIQKTISHTAKANGHSFASGNAKIYHGDCQQALAELPNECVDLIVTSPPYADRRRKTYGGIPPDEYVEWFLLIANSLLRVLKRTGTFTLNIKENAGNGERHTYIIKLILAMRKQGWLWTEEFIWHKRNAYPGKWSNRFRDTWGRLLQFNKHRQFQTFQNAVRIPIGGWAEGRLRTLCKNDTTRSNPATGSGMGRNISNWVGKKTVYPDNVLHLAAECSNRGHNVVFPESLPEWFIKLFTAQGNIVFNPFMGSGTTILAAERMGRLSIGMDIVKDYCDKVLKKLRKKNGSFLFQSGAPTNNG